MSGPGASAFDTAVHGPDVSAFDTALGEARAAGDTPADGTTPEADGRAGRAQRRLASYLRPPITGRRPRWYLEALAVVWLLWVYDAVSSLAPLRRTLALNNGVSIWHAERIVHLDPEAAMDHWLAGHHLLGLWSSNYYDNAHFVVTFAVVGWLWWRHPDRYRPLRTSLVLINVIGFVVFWLVPLAPPRLLPRSHIVDVVAQTHAFGSWHSGTLASATNANELASMPSLHLAWACWSAWAVWVVIRQRTPASATARRGLVLLIFLHPLLTTYSVLATGNHYLFDVLAGVATMVLATLIADRLYAWAPRVRPALGGVGRAVAGAVGAGRSVVCGLHPPATLLPDDQVALAAADDQLEPGPPATAAVPPTLLDGPGAGPRHDGRPRPAGDRQHAGGRAQ